MRRRVAHGSLTERRVPAASSGTRAATALLTYGAATKCPPAGRCSRPIRRFAWQTKQLLSARQPRREELIAGLARVVAEQHDAPRLRIDVLVAERRERDPHLERPAVLGDFRRGVPEEVRRRVLAGRVVGDGVVLHVARA